MERIATEKKEYWFGTQCVVVEVVNTEQEFCWRMCCKDRATDWYSHYPGLLTLTVDDKHYGLVTDYFSGGVFTGMVPFQIIHPMR